jgi:hypothetical protein
VIVSREAAKSQKKVASRFISGLCLCERMKRRMFVIVSREAAKPQKNLRPDLFGIASLRENEKKNVCDSFSRSCQIAK